MTILFALISIALQVGGIFFLFAAGLGLLRFKDPLQRMHAATKAGTIGAGLILAGAVFTVDSVEGVIVGVLAILFLLLTAPVAGHLLGRAAYISGAPLVGLESTDALRGVVDRHAHAGEAQPMNDTNATTTSQAGSAMTSHPHAIPPIEGVRFALIAPGETAVAQRALDIGRQHDLSVQARALIDRDVLEHAATPEKSREMIKQRLADAIGRVEAMFSQAGVRLSMFFSEGDAYTLIPSLDSKGMLLVLPQVGWCDHGVTPPLPAHQAAQLIRLARSHAGPSLLVRQPCSAREKSHIVLVDDATQHSVDALLWALQAGLWQATLVTLRQASPQRVAIIRHALSAAGWAGELRVETGTAWVGPDTASPPDVLLGVAPLEPTDGTMADTVWTDYLNAAAFKEVLMFPRET